MPPEDNLLRLIVAEDSLNDAEQLISVLRNAGYAVRPTRVTDDEELEAALADGRQDLLICAPGLGHLPLEVALRRLGQSGRDTTMLVLSQEDDPDLRREIMVMGAADLVNKEDPEHFRLTVTREFAHLREHRRLRRLEATLSETERRCHALLDSSRDAIAYVHEGMHLYANPAYLAQFGVAAFEEIEGLPLLDLIAPDDQTRFRDSFRRYSRGDHDENEIELSVRDEGGEIHPVVMGLSAASWDGEPCIQILVRHANSDTDLERQLADLSRQDVLTGLYNRNYFMERLDRGIADTLAAEDGGSSGLLYLQADNLEAIRQNLGIAALDLVIRDIGEIIREHTGDRDVAARYADNIFTVLLPERGVHDALGLAEAVRKAVEDHVSETGSRTITKTCSIGVAVLGGGVGNSHQAVNLAYEACEVARRDGGNRVHLHAAEEEADSGWHNRLEDALIGDDFFLVFQPLVSLRGDNTALYETRLRLRDEDGGVLTPEQFIPQAELHNLAAALDRWVVDHALAAAAQQGEAAIMVKISGATLGDADFAAYLGERLRDRGVAGGRLILTLDEPVAVTQLNQAKALYRAAKELRCNLALDRFGSGLNPFQLLKHLPADYIKLDRSLTQNLDDNAARERIAELVEGAHNLRKQVIASYLEEATVLPTLWQLGVDLVQGHFLQEPRPAMDYDFTGMVI